MNLYIAGSKEQIERCELWRDAAIKEGFFITFDWMACVRSNPADSVLHDYNRLEFAMQDRAAIHNCELFWLLLPDMKGAGCFVELGLAIQMNKPIVISGPFKRTIFETLANFNSALDNRAFEQIKEFRKRHV